VQHFLKIGSGVPELEDPEKWHFPLKAFIALTTVLRYRADCDIYDYRHFPLTMMKTKTAFDYRYIKLVLVYQR